MASLKCMNCGLVNFAGSVTCRRCEASLLNRVPPPGPPLMNSAPPPPQGFAPYPPPPAPGGFAGYPPPPPSPGGYMHYPPPPPQSFPVMPPLQQPNAPIYGAPPNAPSYGAPPPPQAFAPPPMPFYGGTYAQAPGVWQDGAILVTTRDIVLPDRCVKCNAPANGYRLKRNLSWHHPLYYLLIFVGWLVYLIVALIIRKTAKVHIGLCEKHLNNRRIAILVSWSLFLLGIVAIILAIANESGAPALLGLMMIIAAAIYGAFGARTVYASKIDERFAWIKGVSSEYLAQFPQWPRYR
jgi:uncharacterized membrane protein